MPRAAKGAKSRASASCNARATAGESLFWTVTCGRNACRSWRVSQSRHSAASLPPQRGKFVSVERVGDAVPEQAQAGDRQRRRGGLPGDPREACRDQGFVLARKMVKQGEMGRNEIAVRREVLAAQGLEPREGRLVHPKRQDERIGVRRHRRAQVQYRMQAAGRWRAIPASKKARISRMSSAG